MYASLKLKKKSILMICIYIQEKCAQYWPDLDESILFGDVVVTTICETQHEYHTSRSLQVTSVKFD